MEFECKLSDAEMREAYRMNQKTLFWLQMMRRNLEFSVLAVAILVGILRSIAYHHPDWTNISIAMAFEVVIVGFCWWRFTRKFRKMTKKANAGCERMSVDARGIATSTNSGPTTFSPWSQYKRWKEGKLVFTITDGKAFRTIPKSAMNEMQIGEVRGILQTQIRSQ